MKATVSNEDQIFKAINEHVAGRKAADSVSNLGISRGNFDKSRSLSMSLIGPSPLLPEYLPLYNETQKRRHEVKAGITGWAQVNGRNAISWQQKFEYDVWYIDHYDFMLDFKIVFLSIKKVFRSDGITSKNSVSAEVFMGNIK